MGTPSWDAPSTTRTHHIGEDCNIYIMCSCCNCDNLARADTFTHNSTRTIPCKDNRTVMRVTIAQSRHTSRERRDLFKNEVEETYEKAKWVLDAEKTEESDADIAVG